MNWMNPTPNPFATLQPMMRKGCDVVNGFGVSIHDITVDTIQISPKVYSLCTPTIISCVTWMSWESSCVYGRISKGWFFLSYKLWLISGTTSSRMSQPMNERHRIKVLYPIDRDTLSLQILYAIIDSLEIKYITYNEELLDLIGRFYIALVNAEENDTTINT